MQITDTPKHVFPKYDGPVRNLKTVSEVIFYSEKGVSTDSIHPEGCITWMLVKGLEQYKVVIDLARTFGVTTVALCDILNIKARPKLLHNKEGIGSIFTYYNLELKRKKLSVWCTKNRCITFQETHDNLFKPIISRLGNTESITRKQDAERLYVVIFDLMIDLYYPVLDILDEQIDSLNEKVFETNDPIECIEPCRRLRQKINEMQVSIRPMQRMLEELIENPEFFTTSSLDYLKDIHVHSCQILDQLDSLKSNVSSNIEMSICLNGNNLNNIMKYLTIISMYFLPLSFLTGIWGMNWEIPEIKALPHYGYYFAWCMFLLVIIAMTFWFKKKKWL